MTSKKLKLGLVVMALFAVTITNAQDKKKPDPEKMFASYDTDKDKLISLDEFKGKKRKKEVEAIVLEKRFAKLDTNNDGTLTLEEFKTRKKKEDNSNDHVHY